MKKYILLLITSFAFGQNPFSKEFPNNTFAIKGCAYLNLIEGGYGGILGFEKGFHKNQSIGVKFIYNLRTPHSEGGEDVDYETINYTYDKDASFILEYKYYFDFKFMRKSDWSPYLSILYKTGKRTVDNDSNYPHDFYHRETNYTFLGPALGTMIVMDEYQRWSIDTQVGYLFGTKKQYTQDAVPENLSFNTDHLRFDILLVYNIDW